LPAGTFIFLLSDFLVPPNRATWTHVTSRRWDVVPVVIQDPMWDTSFPDVAGLTIPFVDANTGEVLRVRLSQREVESRRAENEARIADLRAMFRSLGMEAVELTSDRPADVLGAFLAWADRRMYTRGRKW
jgi:hypothetical protein